MDEKEAFSYTVEDPSTREDLYMAIARANSDHTTVPLKLKAIDNIDCPSVREVEMVPWASARGSLGDDSITGYFGYYLPPGENSLPKPEYAITLSVPALDGEKITATIMRLSDVKTDTKEGGLQ